MPDRGDAPDGLLAELGAVATAAVVGSSRDGTRRIWTTGRLRPEPAARFRIASLTKPFTALAVLAATRASGGALDRPALELLPALAVDWRADPGITVGQLLAQTAGLAATVSGAQVAALGCGDGVAIDVARAVVRAGSVRPPGQRWEYYNGNYFVAGALLATLCGSTFEQALTDLVLRPWGLAATGFAMTDGLVPGAAGGVSLPEAGYPRGRRPSGGLISDAGDLLSCGERLLADPALLDEVARIRTGRDDPMRYGLGWAVGPSGQLYLNGRLPGYRAALLLVPAHRLAAVVLANDEQALPAAARLISALQQAATGDDLARLVDVFAS